MLEESNPLAAAQASAHRKEVTLYYERWRALASGIIETAGSTFLMLIAVRHFQAGETAKALLASGGSAGLLLTPLAMHWVRRLGWRTSAAAAVLAALASLGFLAAALFPLQWVFVAGSLLALLLFNALVPLLTQMYQENYPAAERGKLYSATVLLRIGTAAAFSPLAGWALSGRLERYPWLLLIFFLALFFSAVCLARCPSCPLVTEGQGGPLQGLRWVREDGLFRRALICWSLMGFANLMMGSVRVEYLANARYGLNLGVESIALLTSVLPNLARMLLSPWWGRIFDRVNFFRLRIVLNVGFALGILTFFTGESMTSLVAGALIFGASSAGGDVAWHLWVTKVAPADRVADYMTVHTFLTGLRGLLAPLAAFHLLQGLEISTLGAISAGLIFVATVLLIPEARAARQTGRL